MPLMNMVAGGPGDQFDGITTNQQGHPLGSVMQFADGRRFKYGKAHATALVQSVMCQQTLNDSNNHGLAVQAAAAVGDRTVSLTTGSSAWTVDEFKDGYLSIDEAAGQGILYTIKTNPAAGTSATVAVTLYETVQKALTTSDKATAFINPYGDIIVHPSPATAFLVGITPKAIGSGKYGWFATWGPANCLTEGTVVINEKVIDSASADGAVAPTASTAAGEENYVGVVLQVTATTKHSLIYLRMA